MTNYVVMFLADRYAPEEDLSNDPASGRLYLELLPIDITPLLDNDLTVDLDMSDDAAFVPPPGFKRLRFTLKVDKPMLNPKLKMALNPLAFTIRCATRLPGVIVEKGNAAMQRYVTAEDGSHDPYMLMKRYCQPVYASCILFEGIQAAERLIITPGATQGQKKIRWNHKTVVLASSIDANTIAEFLNFSLSPWSFTIRYPSRCARGRKSATNGIEIAVGGGEEKMTTKESRLKQSTTIVAPR